jgi:hypothetical protein
VARQLYSSTVMRIKQQRQLLVLQLAQLLEDFTGLQHYSTDMVINSVAGEGGGVYLAVMYIACMCCPPFACSAP